MNLQTLVGVALDTRTWLWLRRRYPQLVAKRLKLGYLIVGIHAFESPEIDAGADLWETASEAVNGFRVQEN